MSSTLLTLLGTIGSWSDSFAAHVLALVVAPLVSTIRKQFYPPHRTC